MTNDPEPYVEPYPLWGKWLIFIGCFGFGVWVWYQALVALIEFMRTY